MEFSGLVRRKSTAGTVVYVPRLYNRRIFSSRALEAQHHPGVQVGDEVRLQRGVELAGLNALVRATGPEGNASGFRIIMSDQSPPSVRTRLSFGRPRPGSSTTLTSLVERIRSSAAGEGTGLFLLSGGVGTGKTTASVAPFQAESEPRIQWHAHFSSLGSRICPSIFSGWSVGEVDRLVIDGFDDLSPTARTSLIGSFRKARRGCFLTVTDEGPWIHQDEFQGIDRLYLEPLEDRPEDLEAVAEYLWRQRAWDIPMPIHQQMGCFERHLN